MTLNLPSQRAISEGDLLNISASFWSPFRRIIEVATAPSRILRQASPCSQDSDR
jgi:hypothetical protein